MGCFYGYQPLASQRNNEAVPLCSQKNEPNFSDDYSTLKRYLAIPAVERKAMINPVY